MLRRLRPQRGALVAAAGPLDVPPPAEAVALPLAERCRVRMLVSVTGSRDGEPWPPMGGTIDLPHREAQRLVNAGMAEAADV